MSVFRLFPVGDPLALAGLDPEHWMAIGAIAQALFALMLFMVARRQASVSERVAESTTAMTNSTIAVNDLQRQLAQRDSPRFRVATFFGGNPFIMKRGGASVHVEFDIYNEGHKDSAVCEAYITMHKFAEHGGGEAHSAMTLTKLRRRDGEVSDLMVRAGDYARLAGEVKLPDDFVAATGIDFIMHVVPVIDDENSRGATHFPRVKQ